MANIEEKVEKLVEPKIHELGYEVYDVEYVKEGKNFFLRIFIDKEDGINIEDCEKVNDAITDMLDEASYISEQYFLEISSSGIERILRKDKQLKANLQNEVVLKLFKPVKNKKEYEGILVGFDEENITIVDYEENRIVLERKNISLMKTKFHWE